VVPRRARRARALRGARPAGPLPPDLARRGVAADRRAAPGRGAVRDAERGRARGDERRARLPRAAALRPLAARARAGHRLRVAPRQPRDPRRAPRRGGRRRAGTAPAVAPGRPEGAVTRRRRPRLSFLALLATLAC